MRTKSSPVHGRAPRTAAFPDRSRRGLRAEPARSCGGRQSGGRDRHRHRRLRPGTAPRDASDGTLTTVDIDAENQRLARKTFLDAGVPSNRFRLIAGSALDVVTRLTDGHYDLVFCDADKRENTAYLHEALRLLRPGGVVAFASTLSHGRVADPSHRDPDTTAIRDVIRAIRDDDNLVSALLPVSDGLLAAAKRFN